MGSNPVVWGSDRCRHGSWSTVRREECVFDPSEALHASTDFHALHGVWISVVSEAPNGLKGGFGGL